MGFPTPLDMDKICRVCLGNGGDQELFLIFDEKYAEDRWSIAAMLTECTMYKVERFDELPHLICSPCMAATRDAFRFKNECEQSYRTLVGLLGSSGENMEAFKLSSAIKSEAGEYTEKSTQTDDSTLYPCERCEQKYFTFDALRAHRENKHKGSAIICRFCSKTFNRIGYLKTHIAVYHPESGYTSHNQCRVCKRQFTRREHMRRHLAVIHKIVEIVNDDDDGDGDVDGGNGAEIEEEIEFVPAQQQQEELADNSHGELNIIVETLDQLNDDGNVATTNTLETPTSQHSTADAKFGYSPTQSESDSEGGRSLTINDEPDRLASEEEDEKPLANLKNTMPTKGFMEGKKSIKRIQHEQSSIKKSIPDILAPFKRGRGRPRRTTTKQPSPPSSSSSSSSSSEEREYRCDVCDKAFQRPSTLQRHMLDHTEEKPFSCRICTKSFPRADYLKIHMNSRHDASKVMKCEECQQEFTHITQYKRHKETKHSQKSHNCEICQKNFTTKIYLQRHMTTHGKKRYVCKECSQSYATKEELNAHIKEDGHDKPMLCPECGLRCKTSNILMVHMRRHNGEKPFKCKFCSKGFPRMDDLRVHEKYEYRNNEYNRGEVTNR